MSKTAKITIGCFALFLVVGTITAVGVGFAAYSAYSVISPYTGFASQTIQLGNLEQQYPFAEPKQSETIDGERLASFMEARNAVVLTIEDSSKLVELAKAAESGMNGNQESFGELTESVTELTNIMKTAVSELDANQMSLSEYGWNAREMIRLIYYHAVDGDKEMQDLWNQLEEKNGYQKTDWSLSADEIEGASSDLASFVMIGGKVRPDAESMDIFLDHRDDIIEQRDYIIFEFEFLISIVQELRNSAGF